MATPTRRYFRNIEGDLFTLEDLKYEYESFLETVGPDDLYYNMPFEYWITDWFLSGFDTTELTEDEYNRLKEEEEK